MAQNLLPASNISVGSWSANGAGSLYDCVNDPAGSPDDATTYASSTTNADQFKVALAAGGDPTSSTGHIIHLRSLASGGVGPNFTVSLHQGGTTIASHQWFGITGSYADYTYTLTGTEADSITDYTALELWVSCGGSGGTTWNVTQVYLETPNAPTPVLATAAMVSAASLAAVGNALHSAKAFLSTELTVKSYPRQYGEVNAGAACALTLAAVATLNQHALGSAACAALAHGYGDWLHFASVLSQAVVTTGSRQTLVATARVVTTSAVRARASRLLWAVAAIAVQVNLRGWKHSPPSLTAGPGMPAPPDVGFPSAT